MPSLPSVASLALAASAVAAHPALNSLHQRADAPTDSITLIPIITNDPYVLNPLSPQQDVTLCYGTNGTRYFNATLSTTQGAVKLEALETLASVDCEPDSVSMKFANANGMNSAFTEWSKSASLVLVTNHLGDCDTELERGFFLATKFTRNAASLTVVATAQKKDVSSVASSLRAQFAGIPGSAVTTTITPPAIGSEVKRDIKINGNKKKITTNVNMPHMTLFSDDYVTATADAEFKMDLALSGHFDFDIWKAKLKDLYVDVGLSTSADLVLEVDVKAAYNKTFAYNGSIGYYLVNVPGLLKFGPDLKLGVGADVSAKSPVTAKMDLGAAIENGTMHLDVKRNTTTAAGWTPTYHANLTLEADLGLSVRPFVGVEVALGFQILGGAIDLSAGLKPKVAFPSNVTVVGASTGASAAGKTLTVSPPGKNSTCGVGAEVKSEFEFTLDTYVTQFWSKNLYSYKKPVLNECWGWK